MPTDVTSDVITMQPGKGEQFYIIFPLTSFTAQHAQNVERKDT